MNGILEQLSKDNQIGSMLRQKFVFYIVPMINVDGVNRGNYRTDAAGYNLNRFYKQPSLFQHPPIYGIKNIILYLNKKQRFHYYIDLHAHAGKKGFFIYGNYCTQFSKQVEVYLLPKLLSINCKYFDFEASNFTQKNMYSKDKNDQMSKQGASRVTFFKQTNNPNCWTCQCNYNTGRYINDIPERKYNNCLQLKNQHNKYSAKIILNYQQILTQNQIVFYQPCHFEHFGIGILDSLLDLNKVNPNSRLPNSIFKDLRTLKLHIGMCLLRLVPFRFHSELRKIIQNTINTENEQLVQSTLRYLEKCIEGKIINRNKLRMIESETKVKLDKK